METLSLAQLTASPELLVAFIAGLVIHIGQKMYVNEISFREYMQTNSGRTMLSLGSLVSSYCAVSLLIPEANWLTYLLCGYSVDSITNKAPMSEKAATKNLVKKAVPVNEKVS